MGSSILMIAGWPALGVVVLYTIWVFTRWLRYPRAPGPLLARFSDLWYAYRNVLGNFEKDNVELHRKYGMYRHRPGRFAYFHRYTGPRSWVCICADHKHSWNANIYTSRIGKIVRVGPNLYSIDDADAAKVIYGHGTQFIKGSWYKVWQIPHTILPVNLFALQDIKQHSYARRQYANLYTMSSLVSYEPFVDNCVDILCRRLLGLSKQGDSIDLSRWFQWYAFDVVGEITVCPRDRSHGSVDRLLMSG